MGVGDGRRRMDVCLKDRGGEDSLLEERHNCSQIKNLIFADDGLEMSTCQRRHCNLSS